jgi:hypothetical protein
MKVGPGAVEKEAGEKSENGLSQDDNWIVVFDRLACSERLLHGLDVSFRAHYVGERVYAAGILGRRFHV